MKTKVFFALAILMITLCGSMATADMLAGDIALSTPTTVDLTEQSAVTIAQELFLQQADVIKPSSVSSFLFDFPKLEVEGEELATHSTFVTLKRASSETTSAWVVSFFVKDLNAFAGYVTVESPSGQVIDTAFDYLLQVTAMWEKTKGEDFFWSIEDKYLFQQLFTMPGSGLRRVLPDVNDISQEQATTIAITAVAKQYGVSKSSLRQDYQIDCNLDLQRKGDHYERTWCIIFRHYDENAKKYPQDYRVDILSIDGSILLIEESGSGLG